MSIEDDTEWLRSKLKLQAFHEAHDQKWIAVRDQQVVNENTERNTLEEWLLENDAQQLCIIAFADTRVFV